MLEELVPDPLLENEKLAYLWINILKLYSFFFFYWILSWGLSKYIETKLQTTCFYPLLSIVEK